MQASIRSLAFALIAALLIPSAYADRTPRIIGGTGATEGEFPYIVSLVSAGSSSNFDGHFCGGTLIAGDWVLTAAHCVVSGGTTDSVNSLKVVAGQTTLTQDTTDRFNVDLIVVHPDYVELEDDTGDGGQNDIALLHLDTDTGITAATLADAVFVDAMNDADPIVAVGWGYSLSSPYLQRPLMQKVDLGFITNASCLGFWNISDDVVCAGQLDPDELPTLVILDDKSSCNGDSGTGILSGTTVVAVTSFGPVGCDTGSFPGGYASVGYHREYIDSVLTSADISVTVTGTRAASGSDIAGTFDVTLTNESPTDANNVVVSFFTTSNFVLSDIDSVSGCSSLEYGCTVTTIAAGESVTLTLEATDSTASGSRVLTAVVADDNDYNTDNNTASGALSRATGDSPFSKDGESGGNLPGLALALLAALALRRRR
ncbi:MAG: trypsin-like serine protease [Pseudomonadota bacterium]